MMDYAPFSTVADHHRRCKQIRDDVIAVGYKPKKLFVFLLNTAQFEFLLKEVGRRGGREGGREEGGREGGGREGGREGVRREGGRGEGRGEGGGREGERE